MLVGPPGSGKSTWIREFMNHKNEDEYVIVSSDDIIMELGKEKGLNYKEAFDKHAKQAMKVMKANAKQAFADKKNIIWDQTNMSAKSRASKIQQAKGYSLKAVVWDLPREELDRRLIKRDKEEDKSIPKAIVESMLSNFQMPTEEEGFDMVVVIKS